MLKAVCEPWLTAKSASPLLTRHGLCDQGMCFVHSLLDLKKNSALLVLLFLFKGFFFGLVKPFFFFWHESLENAFGE